jgi:hypothetical protein
MKLYEQEASLVGREKRLTHLLQAFSDAYACFPEDTALCKWMISLASREEKPDYINRYLVDMLDRGIKIPRIDVYDYVKEAVDCEEYDIAERVIKAATQWYQYSRSLNTAKIYLESHRPEDV